jgi:AraC-like DNA-binding protein
MAMRNRPHRVRFTRLGIYTFESRHGENFAMAMDRWDYHKLCLIVKGEGLLETDLGAIPIREHQLLFLPAGMPHRFEDAKGRPLTLVMCCFYEQALREVEFAGEVLDLFRKQFLAAVPYQLTDNYRRVKVMDGFRLMLVEQVHKRAGGEARVWCQLLELLVFLTRAWQERDGMRQGNERDHLIEGVLSYLENNFYRPIKIEELAELANMSYRRFTDYFRRQTGKTVVQYLTEMRVEYAKKLMIETGNILYAAFETGFGDLAHFYRVFKKITGQTPRQFISSTERRQA